MRRLPTKVRVTSRRRKQSARHRGTSARSGWQAGNCIVGEWRMGGSHGRNYSAEGSKAALHGNQKQTDLAAAQRNEGPNTVKRRDSLWPLAWRADSPHALRMLLEKLSSFPRREVE